jgi:hypothetical protein
MTTNPNLTDATVIAARAEYLNALDALVNRVPGAGRLVLEAALEQANLAYFNARRELRNSIRHA